VSPLLKILSPARDENDMMRIESQYSGDEVLDLIQWRRGLRPDTVESRLKNKYERRKRSRSRGLSKQYEWKKGHMNGILYTWAPYPF
jgi:hypothetical protein